MSISLHNINLKANQPLIEYSNMKATNPFLVVLVNIMLFGGIFGSFYLLNERLTDADASILTTQP